MKDLLKQEKGVSLISLAAAIIILGIITSILLYSAKDTKHVETLTNMYTDIENLSDKISSYYATYGKIPASAREIKQDDLAGIEGDIGANDTGRFLVIDLSALENLTLNYGKDYKNSPIFDENGILTGKDLYIINEKSHNIFYLNGIKVDNKTYYTNQDKDTEVIDLRYVDGIKIPDGFKYGGRDSENSITIIPEGNEDVASDSYTWIKLINKLKKFPTELIKEDGTEFTEPEEYKFLESANAYEGYYKGNGTSNSKNVIYLPLNEEDDSAWSPVYTADGVYKDEDGNTAYIPAGFKVSKLPTMNKINKGLVIKDATVDENNEPTDTNGNEYVWISVPKEVIKVSDANGNLNDAVTGTEIENALKKYTKDYREEGYEDTWYDGCGILNKNDYDELKNKTMQSIKEHGGFYIARFEAGIEEQQKTGGAKENTFEEIKNIYGVPVSKKGKNLYNYVTIAQAQRLAANNNNGYDGDSKYNKSLMFGIQWDLVCKFIEETGALNKNEILNYNENIGNYSETVGKTGQYKILNIYDLAGNVSELTLEGNLPITRGGNFENQISMSSRTKENNIDTLGQNIGFRIMFIK